MKYLQWILRYKKYNIFQKNIFISTIQQNKNIGILLNVTIFFYNSIIEVNENKQIQLSSWDS